MSGQQEADWLLDLLRRYPELDRTKSSRFARMAATLTAEGPAVISPSRADFGHAQQAMKDLRELRFIWQLLDPDPMDRTLWPKLQSVFGEEVLPSESKKGNSARNNQFELLARAILQRAGLEPEPLPDGADFRCSLGDWKFAVEAKRVTSLGKLRARISEGAEQTHKTGLPGLLFVDFSEAVNPGDKVLPLERRIDSLRAVQTARFNAFWERYQTPVREAVNGKRILAIVFFDHIIAHNGLRAPGVGEWELWTIRDNVKLAVHSKLDGLLGLLDAIGLPESPS